MSKKVQQQFELPFHSNDYSTNSNMPQAEEKRPGVVIDIRQAMHFTSESNGIKIKDYNRILHEFVDFADSKLS